MLFQPMNAASWLEGLPAPERWRALLLSEGPRIATWVLGARAGRAGGPHRHRSGRRPARKPAPPRASRARARAPAGRRRHRQCAPVRRRPGDQRRMPRTPPATSIPLVLTGIIAGNDPQNGLAILGQNAADRQGVCSRRQRAGRREAAFGVQRPGGDRPRRAARVAGPAAPDRMRATRRRPRPPRCRAENPAIERMRRMISEQPGLIGGRHAAAAGHRPRAA